MPSSAAEGPAERAPAATLAARAGGSDGGAATIASARPPAAAASGAISEASGRFFQYFTGICDFIAWVFSRAGLKMLA